MNVAPLIEEAERQRKHLRDLGLDGTATRPRELEEAIGATQERISQITEDMATRLSRPMLESIERIIRNIQRDQLSQFQRIHQDMLLHPMQGIQSLYQDIVQEQAKQFQKLFTPANEIKALVDTIRHVSTPIGVGVLRHFNPQLPINTHFASSIIKTFEVDQFIRNNINFSTFPESFAAEMLAKFPIPSYKWDVEIDDAEYEEYQKEVAQFIEFVVKWFAELPPSWINFMAVVGFFMAFVVPVYQEYSNQQMERRLTEATSAAKDEISIQTRDFETRMSEQIARLRPATPTPTFYVVQRTATLRAGVRPRSAVIAILPPNQVVELLSARGKWICVRYFDYIEGVPKTGWVLKKYVKLVRNPR